VRARHRIYRGEGREEGTPGRSMGVDGLQGGHQWRRLPKGIMGEEETEALMFINVVE
jgi:hypothetical protein